MRRDERVGPERKPLPVADAGRKRIGKPANAWKCSVDVRAEAVRGDLLARPVFGDESDGVQAGAAHLRPRDAEAAGQLAGPVQEQLGSRVELGEVGLVEPDRRLAHPGAVHDDPLDDLQVAAARRPHPDPLQGAAHGSLLPGREIAEARHLLPVEVGARDVLGELAHGTEAEPLEPLGDLRPDAGQRLDRGFRVDTPARGLRRAGVGPREPGRRAGYGSPSQ